MEREVYNLDKIDFSHINYKKMNEYVRIRYNNSRLMLRTPLLRVSYIDVGDKIIKIKLFINNENDKEYNFGKKLVNLDKFIFNGAKENSNWFDGVNYDYVGLINDNELMLKFKKSDNIKIKCNGEVIDIKELKKNYLVKVIFDVSGLFINSNKFGIYLKPYLIDINVDYIFYESEDEIIKDYLIDGKYSLSSSENDNNYEKKDLENNIEMNI